MTNGEVEIIRRCLDEIELSNEELDEVGQEERHYQADAEELERISRKKQNAIKRKRLAIGEINNQLGIIES